MDFHHIFHSRCVVSNDEMVDFSMKDKREYLSCFEEAREYNSCSFDPSLPPIFDEEIEEVTKRRVLPLKEELGQILDNSLEDKFAHNEFTCAYKSPLDIYIDSKLYDGVSLNVNFFAGNFIGVGNNHSSYAFKHKYGGTDLLLEGWYYLFEGNIDKLVKFIEDDELKEYSNVDSNLLVISFATSLFCELTRFVFDPGGFHSSKNRDDSF